LITIRAAAATDAAAIGQLAEQFAAYLRGLGDPTDFKFTAATYLRDGFGSNPAFAGVVAEQAGEVIGYLLYHFGYDTDRAIRLLHVIDLYVREDRRGFGTGRALMREAAKICREGGGQELFWAVYIPNQLAARFYERLGAHYIEDLKFMVWPGSRSETP
jgi:GNAT superfamily N-acetyltransferase